MIGGPSYHLRATPLPGGDRPIDFWVAGGRLTFEPQDGAVELAPEDGYVLPGLVDAHVHATIAGRQEHHLPIGSRELTDANRRLALERGTLVLRDMGPLVRRGERGPATLGGIDSSDGLPRVHAAGEMLSPGGFSGAERVAAPHELVETGLAQVREAGSAHGHGAPWVKVILENFVPSRDGGSLDRFGRNYDGAQLGALARAVRDAGGRTAAHALGRAGAAACIEAGVDSIEHGWGLDPALVDRLPDTGIAWTPTLYVLAQIRERASEDAAQWRWANEAFEQTSAMVARAHSRGVTLLAGTDSGAAVSSEVEALHAAGLSPRDALAAASTGARAFLGEPGLEEGALADLVVFAADPREDRAQLRQPRTLMINGLVVDPP